MEMGACLCEWRGGLRAGTHADCPIHGRPIPTEELERWERETGEHRDSYPLDPDEYWARVELERLSKAWLDCMYGVVKATGVLALVRRLGLRPKEWVREREAADPERVSFVADEYWLAWWMSGVHRDDPVYSDEHLGLALDLRETLPPERIARGMLSVGLQIRDREA